MTASSPASRAHRALAVACSTFAALVPALLTGCGNADPAPGASGAGAGGASGGSAGATGGSAGRGSSGTAPNGGQGGRATTGSGGTSGTAGKASMAAGKGGGGSSLGGQGGLAGPPEPGPDGLSPYERECRGDTVMCEDVERLRCLGIRDDATIYGYSCSNVCETDADCSNADSSAEASAACVDFVTQRHCLLVCLSGGEMLACPEGMGCYVYPQSSIGYCLWQ